MPPRTLVIGNKVYSSWSLRPWLLLRQLDVPFQEVQVLLDRPDTAAQIAKWSPAGRVPVLVDGDVTVWDSIAIMDHIADTTDAPVWPTDRAARATARSVAAEMHAGFGGLRSAYPMNLGKKFAFVDAPAAAPDVARVFDIVMTARQRFGHGGPFLFGAFSAADAMYAPVVTRFDTYSVPVPPGVAQYMETILGLPAFQTWREAALKEPWIVHDDEVAREPIEVYRATAETSPTS